MTSKGSTASICALNGIFDQCTNSTGSNEHIIPNAIGGRKKSSECICTNCNSKSGDQWDAALCKQFNILCIWFGIRRERGTVQNETVREANGEEIVLSPRGTVQPRMPQFSEVALGKGRVIISVQSNNRDQAIKMIKGIAKKKGYAYSLTDLEYSESLLDGDLEFVTSYDLASPKIGRSVTKMIYLFSISNGLKKDDMPTAWAYLSQDPSPQCFCPYYDDDPIKNRPAGIPIHVLHVVGDPQERILYGYVELFGLFKYIFKLSDSYAGEKIEFTHALDPTKGREIDLAVELCVSRDALNANLKPTQKTADAQNKWVAENIPLYMRDWIQKNQEHRLGLLIERFVSEYGNSNLASLPGWLEREL